LLWFIVAKLVAVAKPHKHIAQLPVKTVFGAPRRHAN